MALSKEVISYLGLKPVYVCAQTHYHPCPQLAKIHVRHTYNNGENKTIALARSVEKNYHWLFKPGLWASDLTLVPFADPRRQRDKIKCETFFPSPKTKMTTNIVCIRK